MYAFTCGLVLCELDAAEGHGHVVEDGHGELGAELQGLVALLDEEVRDVGGEEDHGCRCRCSAGCKQGKR